MNTEGKVSGKSNGRRRYQNMDSVRIEGKFDITKILAQNRNVWRKAAAGPF